MEVKSLLVKFGTDTKAMESGFKKADGLIQANAAKFKKAGAVVTAAGAAIVGTIGLMVKSYAAAGDEVHKMALRTGFSTEALSELKYAADISGTSLASVEKGVKKMASSIGEAELGVKTYTDAFKLIGIEVEELQGLNPEEQFMKMAAGIAEIEDPTQRAYAAQKLLGRAGTELLPLFAEGAEGMEALRQKARDMGLSISGPAAQGAADLTDAMTDMKGSFKGVTMAIAEQLAPIIQGLVETVTNIVLKAKDWIKENPILAGVLMKVVGAVGILATVLGPILIMLPALAGGFTILWGAITGPVGIVLGAIALVAGAAFLIYKNWEPIKEFFIGLWEDVSGFFVNAFDSIKKKLLDWSITIAGILEKIPIAKKLAGPWKESLESMRAEMDTTVANVDTSAQAISESSMAIGQAWFDAVAGSTALKDASAILSEEGLSLASVFKIGKVAVGELGKAFGKTDKSIKNTGKVIAKTSTKITGLITTMTDEIKKATLDEYNYSKWALAQKLAARKAAIEAEEAGEEQKNQAIAMANENHYEAMATLEKDHAAATEERQKTLTENIKGIWSDYWAAVKAKQTEYKAAEEELVNSINQLTMDKLEYANWALDEQYAKQVQITLDTVADATSRTNQLMLLERQYLLKKGELADQDLEDQKARIDAEEAYKKQSLENTLADISGILNAIGSLFSQAHQNRMTEIDQEETRRIDAINAMYDAQIAALQGIVEAEERKTQEVLDSINQEYDDKRDQILNNMEDNEERAAMLAALEQEREDRLAQALLDREAAEQAAIDAVVAMEDTKNTALETLAEDLETERAKERKKAAKQEKAVALLAAIVNTAAAIAKALPNIPLAVAVGILGAIQIAIIKAQPLPLKEGGIVTSPTIAEIGEAGPEAVIPLNKLGGLLQPAPVYVKMSLYNYGDINNVGDLDDISDQLARRMTRQLERGRRS